MEKKKDETREPTMAEVRARLKYIKNEFWDLPILSQVFDLLLIVFDPVYLDGRKYNKWKAKK